MQLSVISCRKVTDNQGSTGHVDAVPRMSHFQAFCESNVSNQASVNVNSLKAGLIGEALAPGADKSALALKMFIFALPNG